MGSKLFDPSIEGGLCGVRTLNVSRRLRNSLLGFLINIMQGTGTYLSDFCNGVSPLHGISHKVNIKCEYYVCLRRHTLTILP